MTWSTARYCIVLTAAATAGAAYDRSQRTGRAEAPSAAEAPSSVEGKNVILVVSDGLRWQEVFRGADSLLVFGSRTMGRDAADVRRRYWRATVAERREALMPFVWSAFARNGQLIGNRDIRSSVKVTNGMNFSYPGYSEMLVGFPDARINRNSYGPNPNVTVFEWLNRREDFRGRVAAVGAWNTFEDIFNLRRSRIHMHASRRDPLDVRSHAAALAFLKQQRPRALFVAYVETDDHAHAGRYDRTLNAAHAVDSYLAALWTAVQSDVRYRGQTTLIFTADHGRGSTSRDWRNHGEDVRGADDIFVAMMGPDVPALGEVQGGRAVEAQIAATVAAAVGLDFREDVPRAAAPIRGGTRRGAAASAAQ